MEPSHIFTKMIRLAEALRPAKAWRPAKPRSALVRHLSAGLLVAAVATMTTKAEAQEHEFQSWSAAFTQWSVGEKVEFWFDGHARRRSASSLFVVRPAIGYRLLHNLKVHAGYAWVPTVPDVGSLANEHRIWQQVLWTPTVDGGFAFALRPRLEQRFSDAGGDVGHRARLFARASFQPRAAAVMLVAWDEAFLQLGDTDWGASGGFDQNRLFVGVGFPSQSGVRFEVGYLNALLNREPQEIAHVLAINGFFAR